MTTFEPVEGNRHPVGRILSCEGGILRLETEAGQRIAIPFSTVASGRLEVEMEPTGRRGRR